MRKTSIDKRLQFLSTHKGTLGMLIALCLFAFSLVVVSADSGGDDVASQIEADLAGAAINGLIPRGEAEFKIFASLISTLPTSICRTTLS